MPLGLLARDSMANLASFGRDSDADVMSDSTLSTQQLPLSESIIKATTTAPVVSDSAIPQHKDSPLAENGGFGSVLSSQTSNGISRERLASIQQRRRQRERQQQQQQEQQQQHQQDDGGGTQQQSRISPSNKEANPQQPPSFHYAGYTEDYYGSYEAYTDHDPFTVPDLFASKRSDGFWCCLFPWLIQQPQKHLPSIQDATERSTQDGNNPVENGYPPVPEGAAPSNDEDSREGESTNSNILGERLSDRERQAVLARLRLAQPESIVHPNQHHGTTNGLNESHVVELEESLRHIDGHERVSRTNKGLLNGIPVYDISPLEKIDADKPMKLKGILKTRSANKIEETLKENSEKATKTLGDDPSGSSISSLPKPRRSLFPTYEDRRPRSTDSVNFAPMARVVTVKSKNDMTEEEKSDIWWQRSDYEDFRKAGRIITRAMLEGGGEIWLASTESSVKKKEKGGTTKGSQESGEVPGDKWWHKFGHSRRGLEHVVSVDEGRQRQVNVKNAIRAVVEEQARQKMVKREDAEKLRMVSLQHTSWARDLALASGASDADAVQSHFAEGRRSREFYLLKMSRNKPPSVNTNVYTPQFMLPTAVLNAPKTPIVQQRLDAHTASQIQFRRKKVGPAADTPTATESLENVHDPLPEGKGKESLAHQAAGFSADGKKVNMAAVLSGMGAVGVKGTDEKRTAMRVAS